MVAYETGGPAFESHRTWFLHNEVYLEDPTGKQYRLNGGSESMQQGEGTLGIEYSFVELPDPLPDFTFVYVAPTLIVDVPIEFEIESVPVAGPSPPPCRINKIVIDLHDTIPEITAMNARDAIKLNINSANMICQGYLADLTDAELLIRPVPGANHIAWQLGHLLVGEHGRLLEDSVSRVDARAAGGICGKIHQRHVTARLGRRVPPQVGLSQRGRTAAGGDRPEDALDKITRCRSR